MSSTRRLDPNFAAPAADRPSLARRMPPDARAPEPPAIELGERTTAGGAHQVMYRLGSPLVDVWPAWRNVLVSTAPDGTRTVHRAWAYEGLDTRWLPVPPPGEWIACCSPLTARDLASAEEAIALLTGAG